MSQEGTPPVKRCFVISPIGPEGSPVREHADDVFEFIIEPALTECGFKPYRSDHLQESGKISEQMFRAILSDDLCVAVLTGKNPNVFYELAIAQFARRPVILLLLKGEDPPFDIRDLRLVYYDLKPKPLREKIYQKEITAHIQNLEAASWKVPSILGDIRSGEPSDCVMFERATQYGSKEDWMQLLRDSECHFDIMGLTLRAWSGGKNFSTLLLEKATAGCRVRILLIDPTSPVLPYLFNSSIPEEQVRSIVDEAQLMYDYFSGIAKQGSGIEVRQIKVGCPHFQICRTDKYLTYLSYLYSESSDYSPLWQVPADSYLYGLLVQEFESIWIANRGSGQAHRPT